VIPAVASADDDKTPAPAPPGNSDEGSRLQRLEKELAELKAESAARKAGLPDAMSLDQEKKEVPKTDEVQFKATFTDGFHIKSTDGNFDLHIGGRWEEEYRYTFNRPTDGGIRTSTNTFYVREAFISVDGTLFHDWGFKLNGDFTPPQTATVGAAGSTVSTGAIIEEGWFEWKALQEFRMQFGSFKQPLSMETTDSPRFAALIQRSPMARFLPNFDLGLKAYGSFWDTALTYELALTNGRSHLANSGRGNPDDNDGKEYAGRITTAPFVADKESILRGLRFGLYGSFAHVGEGSAINPVGWPGGLATNELVVTYLVFTPPAGTRFVGDRYRVGGEATYAYGPFMVRGELMSRHDEVSIGGTNEKLLETLGYYTEASFVVTGEDRLPNARIVPKEPFSLKNGTFGALEIAARYGTVSLDRGVLTDLTTDFNLNSNRVSSITLGANWWPSQNVKIAVNYIGEDYHQGVQLSTAHHGSHAHGVLAHFQIDF
jgi:phosphate-selective porin OprO/OprP